MNSTSLCVFYLVMAIALIISFFFDRQKTMKGLKIGWKKFSTILPGYIKLLILLSVVLLLSDRYIIEYLSGPTAGGLLLALLIGSVTIIPSFVAYPLAGILLARGVSYMVIAGFVTSLMLVGVVTYPVEKEYFGVRATLVRNGFAFAISAIIAICIGIFYGEIF